MRVAFDTVFTSQPGGMLTPRCVVQIGGVTMTPGTTFSAGGVSFGGFNLAAAVGRDLEVDQLGPDKVEIKGHY